MNKYAFDIDGDINPPVGVVYPPGLKDENGKLVTTPNLKIRAHSTDIYQNIRDKYFKDRSEYVPNTRTNRMDRVEYVENIDEDGFKKELWDYNVVWFDFVDAKGDQIEVTKENKARLMGNPRFYHFVDKVIKQITDDDLRRVEIVEGN